MKRFASLMNGEMAIRVNYILRLTLARPSSWLKNTAAKAIRAVLSFDYVDTGERTLYQIRKRWHYLMMKTPARQEAKRWQKAYWEMYDDWSEADTKYHSLYSKYLDLLEEVKYWETRQAKVFNYIEKQMEMSEGGK